MEVECRVIAAAMEELHIQDINDIPLDGYMPSNLTTKKEKRDFLEKLAVSVVDKYILQCDKVELLLQKTGQAQNQEVVISMGMTADGRFMCRHPGRHKTFRYDGKHWQQHEATDGLAVNETFNPEAANQKEDDMHNYQVSLMEYGMIIKNFYDAVSEGDGGRVFLNWKFMLLYLKNDGTRSKKYALEAFYMMCQFFCLLSERGAHRLIWNRFIKNWEVISPFTLVWST